MIKLANDPRVIRFLDVTRSYCELVEAPESVDIRVFVERCYHFLLNLLSMARKLPDADGDLDTYRVTTNERSDVERRIKNKLGRHDLYWMVFEPFETTKPDTIFGSISDDLTDIWGDLKTGLNAASAGSLDNAVCDWRFSFETHWGPYHAAHAIRPLFGLFIGEFAPLNEKGR